MASEVCLAGPKSKGKQVRAELMRQINVDKAMQRASIADKPDMAVSVKLMKAMGWRDGQGLGAALQGMAEPLAQTGNWANKGLGYDASGGELKFYSVINEKFEAVFSHLGKVHSSKEEKPNLNVSKQDSKLNSDAHTSDSESDSSESEGDSSSGSESDDSPVKAAPRKRFNRASLLKPKLARCNAPSAGKEVELKARRLGAKAQQLYQPYSNGSLELAPKRGPSPPRMRQDNEGSSFSAPGFGLGFSGGVEPEAEDSKPAKPVASTLMANYTSGFVLGEVMYKDKVKQEEEDVKVKIEEVEEEGGKDAAGSMFDSVKSRYSNSYMSAFVKSEDRLDGTIEEADTAIEKPKKIKKKNKKSEHKDDTLTGNIEIVDKENNITSSMFDSVQSRYSNNYSNAFVKSEDNLEGTIETNEGEQSIIEKPKKSKKKNQLDTTESVTEAIVEPSSVEEADVTKIKKKKKRSSQNCEEVIENAVNLEDSELPTKKCKKKNKKRNGETICDTTVDDTTLALDNSTKTKKVKNNVNVSSKFEEDSKLNDQSFSESKPQASALFNSLQSKFLQNYASSFVKSEEKLEGTIEKGDENTKVDRKKSKKSRRKLEDCAEDANKSVEVDGELKQRKRKTIEDVSDCVHEDESLKKSKKSKYESKYCTEVESTEVNEAPEGSGKKKKSKKLESELTVEKPRKKKRVRSDDEEQVSKKAKVSEAECEIASEVTPVKEKKTKKTKKSKD